MIDTPHTIRPEFVSVIVHDLIPTGMDKACLVHAARMAADLIQSDHFS